MSQPAVVRHWPWAVGSASLLLVAASVALFQRYSVPALLFLPVGLLAIPLVARRLLSDPVPIFALFVLVAVNLDFIKIGDLFTVDILLSLGLIWVLIVRWGMQDRKRLDQPVVRAMIVFLGITLVSVVLSVNPVNSVKNWVRDVEYLLILLFILGLQPGAREARILTGAVIASAVIPCVLGLAGFFLGIDMFYGLDTPIGGGETVKRISATLSHPVTFSHYLSFVSVLTLSFILTRTWFARRYLVPVFVLQMAALYFTYGRTGWVEFLVAVVVLLWLRGNRRLLLLGLPVALVILIQLVPTFLARWETVFEASNNNSFLWRLGLWAYALSLFPARKWFGSGQDTFIEYVSYEEGFASHHTWIGMLVETGLFGMVAFLILVVLIVRILNRERRIYPQDPLVLGVLAGLWGFLAGSFAGDPFGLPSVVLYFWVGFSLILSRAAARDAEAERTAASP